jgi:hypothetical protein
MAGWQGGVLLHLNVETDHTNNETQDKELYTMSVDSLPD